MIETSHLLNKELREELKTSKIKSELAKMRTKILFVISIISVLLAIGSFIYLFVK
jgi:hypothetical protein